ncbi:MAG TPA: protocatechuate 3,4-dioxygenase subunit alpha [Thermohalobaculum sp.]|nr:protocatechuate 3,4-dioxygenase subunit alpha [Thermohalobaculum sp.]
MVQKLHYDPETPSQTAGPFVHIGLAPKAAGFEIFDLEIGEVIAGPGTKGERIRVEGRVLDGTGAPVKDVLIEIWQANAQGAYNHPEDTRDLAVEPDFRGWGRVVPDFETGVFAFETVKPGPVPAAAGRSQAPHLNLWLVARGINIGLATRMYFADEEAANAADPLLARIESPARRQTLIAARGGAEPVYCFDIHLQGPAETVFLDI